jgi:hypothetical protein
MTGAFSLYCNSEHVVTRGRLLLVYLVAAVRVGDVLCVRHEVGELLLSLFLRGIGDVAEVLRHVGRQRAGRNH